MSERIPIDAAYTRRAVSMGRSAVLTTDDNLLAQGTFLHADEIVFNEVFPETYHGYAEVSQIVVRESVTPTSMPMTIYLFDESDVSPVIGGAFALTSGTKIENLLGVINVEIGDYVEVDSNNRIAIVKLSPGLIVRKTAISDARYIKAVALAAAPGSYGANSEVEIEIGLYIS